MKKEILEGDLPILGICFILFANHFNYRRKNRKDDYAEDDIGEIILNDWQATKKIAYK
jgi:hypothetical protein